MKIITREKWIILSRIRCNYFNDYPKISKERNSNERWEEKRIDEIRFLFDDFIRSWKESSKIEYLKRIDIIIEFISGEFSSIILIKQMNYFLKKIFLENIIENDQFKLIFHSIISMIHTEIISTSRINIQSNQRWINMRIFLFRHHKLRHEMLHWEISIEM